jgi:glucose/arabinose dehydrogenase
VAHAQATAPARLHPNLAVRAVATGLRMPTNIAFLAAADALVIETSTGRVLHFANASFRGVALDLSVNFASERGLLGIALHPQFPSDPGVYLYWTCRSSVARMRIRFCRSRYRVQTRRARCPTPTTCRKGRCWATVSIDLCGTVAPCGAGPDDQFGGPNPDNAHLSGVILRFE